MILRLLLFLGLALGAFFLSGCLALTPPATAAESRGLTVAAKSSRQILVYRPRLQMNRGHLELAGQIAKQPAGFSTSFSHLDVQFFNGSGSKIATKPIRFSPRSVGQGRISLRAAHYVLNLDSLPTGAVRIEVQADDADIEATHKQRSLN